MPTGPDSSPKRPKTAADGGFATSLLMSVFFGLAAGAVGMLVALAYGDIPMTIQPVATAVPRSGRPQIEYPSLPERDLSRSAALLFAADAEVMVGGRAFFVPSDALAAGIVLTSDGWLITHEGRDGRSRKAERTLVDGRSYDVVDDVVDPYTGIVFMKVDAADLPVTPFGKETELEPGDVLFAMDAAEGVRRVEVLSAGTVPEEDSSDIVRSSERVQQLPRLSGTGGLLPGAVLTDHDGEVVAVFAGEGEHGGLAVPVGAFLRQITAVLRDGAAVRPYLGVRYADLARTGDGGAVASGALLTPSVDGRLPAVQPRSPAASAGLRAGDVIIAVNGERVSVSNPLSALIADYAAGETVSLEVVRGTRDMVAEAVLGETPVR